MGYLWGVSRAVEIEELNAAIGLDGKLGQEDLKFRYLCQILLLICKLLYDIYSSQE